MEEEVIRVDDIVRVLKDKWKMIVVITTLTTVVAAFFTFYIIEPEYESSTKLFVGKEQTEANGDYSNNDIQMYQKLVKTYVELVKTNDLIANALGANGIYLTSEEVINNLTVSSNNDTQIIKISYKGNDPYQVNNVLQVIATAFIQEAKMLIPNGKIQIVEASQVSQTPVSPNKKMNIAIAFVLGLMVSIGVVFLLEYLDNSFKDKDDLEKTLDIPVLGNIPLTETK